MIPLATVTKTLWTKATPATQHSLRQVARFSGRDYSHLCRQNSKLKTVPQRVLPTGGAKRPVCMEAAVGTACILAAGEISSSRLFFFGCGLFVYAAYQRDVENKKMLKAQETLADALEALAEKNKTEKAEPTVKPDPTTK